MITPLPPEILAWLHQAVLGHVLERLKKLETAQQPTDHSPGATEMVATSEPALVATEQGLVLCYAKAVEDTLKADIGIDNAAANAGRFVVHNLNREPPAAQPPAAEPAPPPAPVGGLVKRVATAMHPNYPRAFQGEARAAICEVAAWLDQQGQHGCLALLRAEADR